MNIIQKLESQASFLFELFYDILEMTIEEKRRKRYVIFKRLLKGKAGIRELKSYMDGYRNDDVYPTMESFIGLKSEECAAILKDEKIAEKILHPYVVQRVDELVARLNEAARGLL